MSSETFRERTNATQYQQKQRLPPNFATVLKEYTREVLRYQPEDILDWSAKYFKKLAIATDPMLAKPEYDTHDTYSHEVDNIHPQQEVDNIHPQQEVAAMKISKVFATMDTTGCGRLYVYLIKRALMESFGLSRQQALYILSCEFAEIHRDAMMEYRSIAHHAVSAVLYFQQQQPEFPVNTNYEEASVHGLMREEVEEALTRTARDTDADGLGRISYGDYKSVLEVAPIDLTRRDINVLLAEAEITRDGTIDIKSEVANAFSLLQLSASFAEFEDSH
eukprot:Tbor_TRINITY_DN4202_c0_g1::TRINITY_DN4202_c0_g1_i1::g.23894::m.23894